MRITLCARAKILSLLSPGTCFRVAARIGEEGIQVELEPNSTLRDNDCPVCLTPMVVADIGTTTVMTRHVIDYSYDTNEFVITTRNADEPAA